MKMFKPMRNFKNEFSLRRQLCQKQNHTTHLKILFEFINATRYDNSFNLPINVH